ncbi:nitroreductase family protein [Candidatus Solirubrobacter pratensis]|uniref:nitroreductase family protein n=1 Tax=Candidatus Solirubrobacter pratensis TaxID=1298857 RepID=UPI0003FA7556|nr:nitroreductase family protein [Candidatus Solirubrobacter pratensis]
MPPGDTARLYHRLTSYAPEREWMTAIDDPRVMQGFVQNDMATVPEPCKAYPAGLPAVELPREWPEVSARATEVLGGRCAEPSPLDVPALARLLYLSSGVVRVAERHARRWLFRAAGSAGGRFPLELYVAARGVEGVPDAVYWYDPVGHALLQIGPAAAGEATTLVATGVPWRTGWRYAERGFRHIYWDAGTMLAQALMLAGSGGLRPRLFTRFADADVARLVGADGTHEFPVAVVVLGDGEPAIEPQADAARGAVDAEPLEFPLVTLAQHAGDADALGEPWPEGAPLGGDAPPSATLDEIILRRGSTRIMDPAATIPRAVLDFSLAASLRSTRVPHFIAVHGVEGLAPGLYRWPDLDAPRRHGNLREQVFRICMEQDLARDAAFVVMAAADLDRLDDRGYREAQLDAGLVEGRLHLAAYALGIGASGMTFFDSEIPTLLGKPLSALLFTCIGVPTYRHKDGGRPGEPSTVVLPRSR